MRLNYKEFINVDNVSEKPAGLNCDMIVREAIKLIRTRSTRALESLNEVNY